MVMDYCLCGYVNLCHAWEKQVMEDMSEWQVAVGKNCVFNRSKSIRDLRFSILENGTLVRLNG